MGKLLELELVSSSAIFQEGNKALNFLERIFVLNDSNDLLFPEKLNTSPKLPQCLHFISIVHFLHRAIHLLNYFEQDSQLVLKQCYWRGRTEFVIAYFVSGFILHSDE